MQVRSPAQHEALQDVWYGQIVTVVARWFLIFGGLMLTFWRAETVNEAVVPTYLIVMLIATNFLLHGRYLVGVPMRREVVLAGCVIDVAIISLVIATGRWDAAQGIDNPFYIFYYPVLLAFALVFSWRPTVVFAVAVITTYMGIVVLSTPEFLTDRELMEPMVARVVTLATTAFLGNMFWRIQRQWRRSQLAAIR